jgi:hypothetical protein
MIVSVQSLKHYGCLIFTLFCLLNSSFAQPGNDADSDLLTASIIDKQIHLSWETNREKLPDHYIIEQSSDGASFLTVGMVRAGSKTSHKYSIDLVNQKGVYFFRIKSVYSDSLNLYSKIAEVSIGPRKVIAVFPNPSTGKLTLAHPFATGNEKVQVLDMQGNVYFQVVLQQASVQTVIDLTSLNKGSYQLVWFSEYEKLTQKIMLQ